MTNWQITCHKSFENIPQLGSVWSELLAAAQIDNIFLWHDWIRLWWQSYGDGHDLWILVARDGNLVGGIAPLYMRRQLGGVRKLAFLGDIEVSPNHLDFLIRPNEYNEVMQAICQFLWQTRASWDLLELRGFTGNTHTLPMAVKFFRQKGLRTQMEIHVRCPYIKLPKSYDEYIQERSSKTRKNIRRLRRRLFEDFPNVHFGSVIDPEELKEVFSSLVSLHQARWMRQGLPGAFANLEFVEFHQNMARIGLEQSALRMYYLKVGANYIAVMYGYRSGGRYFDYLTGFDEQWDKYSVGNLLIAYVIEQLINDEMQEFDFLQGEGTYKFKWATDVRNNYYMRVTSSTVRGRVVWETSHLIEVAQQVKRKIFPASFRRELKQLLGMK